MAESNTTWWRPETDMTTLKEALRAQQQLLQKLYSELDEEREASATAASEALSMILRLQGEKASVKMEAGQYKRMAEERMSHAEATLAFFEELIYQKEMEIASLEFQVQAYRCKLLSLGYSDPIVGEAKYPENLSLQRNDSLGGDMSVKETVRRNKSLPPILMKDSYHKKGVTEREKYMISLIPRIVEESMDYEHGDQYLDVEKKSENTSALGDYDSYWEQIRRLDKKVKELSDCKDSSRGKSANLKACSKSSSLTSYDLTRGDMTTQSGEAKHSEGFLDGAITNSLHSFGSPDMFEVPKAIKKHKSSEWMQKEQRNIISEGEVRLLIPDSISKAAAESFIRDQIDCDEESFLIDPTSGMAIADAHAEIQQLTRGTRQLQVEQEITRQDNGGEEELKLLREIQNKLNSIQAEIQSLRPKKRSPPQEDPALVSLREVSPFPLALSI